jgi:hypothetical protein
VNDRHPTTDPRCCHCGCKNGTGPDELRPYGPGGAWVCFRCAMLPKNLGTTETQFRSQLDAAGSVVVIGEPTGPRPLDRETS